MDIKNKRIGFMFNILVAIFTAIIMNDRTGLFVSTLIIIVLHKIILHAASFRVTLFTINLPDKYVVTIVTVNKIAY